MMKKVEAIIRHFKLEDVKTCLNRKRDQRHDRFRKYADSVVRKVTRRFTVEPSMQSISFRR